MRPIVARLYNCMVGCDTCAKLCPRDAILFPPLGYLRKIRDKAQAIIKSKKNYCRLRKNWKDNNRLS